MRNQHLFSSPSYSHPPLTRMFSKKKCIKLFDILIMKCIFGISQFCIFVISRVSQFSPLSDDPLPLSSSNNYHLLFLLLSTFFFSIK